jgi:O-antigen ligase/tetratricopeptide (TPR) repeat protein
VLFSLVALAPWAFGAVEPVFESGLLLGLAALLLLTAARALIEHGVVAAACPVALVLAGLFLATAAQVAPLPGPVVAALSPNTARLTGELLPATPELLPGEPDHPSPGWHTLSLDPSATRQLTVQMLGLALVYWVARTQVAAPASFRRLGWVLLVNGTLLAAVGIAQRVSSPPTQIYWTFPVDGASVFGPFVDRDHFPFYACFCLGLGAGLLASPRWFSAIPTKDQGPRTRDVFGEMLQSPRTLWVSAGLAVMLAGLLLSQSRGGVLAFAVAAAVIALVGRARAGRSPLLPAVLVVGLLTAALVAWLGWGAVERRLKTLIEPDLLHEGRLTIWADALPLVPAFLLTGTGGGTFRWVEPLHRTGPTPYRIDFEHAHNEYLEALVEGGVVRLALTLVLIVVLARGAARAWRRSRGRSDGGLVLGAAFGLLAVALHGMVDFGLHIPAVALLAAVVAAQLMAAAEGPVEPARPPWPWPVVVLTAAALGLIAAGLAVEGWTAERVDRLRRAGGTEHLRAATELRPSDGRLLLALAQAELADDPHSVAGLAHLRDARDRSPLLPAAHAHLAARRDGFARADAASAYLERACRLQPDEAEFQFACGSQYLREGQQGPAWDHWRRGLALSDRHLKEILDAALPLLGPAGVAERVVPDRPDLLVAAAEQLDAPDQRRPFLTRAVDLLREPATGTDWHVRARAEDLLGRPDAAADYRAALAREPGRTAWRFELVALLRRQRKWDDAEAELKAILARHPGDEQARDLLLTIDRESQLDRP